MKDLEEASYILRIHLIIDCKNKLLALSQALYIDKKLVRYSMQNSKKDNLPSCHGVVLSKKQCPSTPQEEEDMRRIPYASIVGSLMYSMLCTRPDIAFAIGMLGRYQSNPGVDHQRAAKKVLRYLQGTKNYMLMYRQTDNLEVTGYSNSDFTGYVQKSTSGYIFIFFGGAVSWRSAKQTLTATSTIEAEFVSCFEATLHGV